MNKNQWKQSFNKFLRQYAETNMPAWNTTLTAIVSHCKVLRIHDRFQILEETFIQFFNNKKNNNASLLFKNLIVWHKIITEMTYISQKTNIMDQLPCLMIDYTQKVNQNQVDLNLQLFNDGLAKYMFYIQKRQLFGFLHLNQDKQENKKNNSKKEEDKQIINQFGKCYQILNILNCGLSTLNFLQNLRRYNRQKSGYILDFNCALASDFTSIYDKLAVSFKNLTLSYFSHHQSPNSQKEHIQTKNKQLQQLLKQIEKTHEKLYRIYNNHDFACYTRKYKPNYIDLQHYYNQSEILLKNSRNKYTYTLQDDSNILQEIQLSKSSILLSKIINPKKRKIKKVCYEDFFDQDIKQNIQGGKQVRGWRLSIENQTELQSTNGSNKQNNNEKKSFMKQIDDIVRSFQLCQSEYLITAREEKTISN